jgi:IMP dehydrogenase
MKIVEEALTFDDVLLMPLHSEVVPAEVNIKTKITRKIAINIPILSAAMDTVTEARLAIALAQEGGIGIIHKSMTISEQAAQVAHVKRFESGIVKDAITISPTATVAELKDLTRKHNISGVPVVDGKKVVGIVTNRDVRFETNLAQPVYNIMTKQDHLVTVKEGEADRAQILSLLHKHRIEKILMVTDSNELAGLITVKDIFKAQEKPFSSKDEHGRLLVGAAVGVAHDTEERISELVNAGVDVIVVDTAHGHSQKVIDRVAWVKKNFPEVQVIGGNIATYDAARALYKAGADAVKVGIGPGSICTTRIIAGVGVPQITAIANVYSALKNTDVAIIADGGIRHSGDIVKAIAAGADSVMMGGMFAGTEEAPGEVELFQGRSYKSYRGMGSLGAMASRYGSSDRYFQENTDALEKLVPEGIEGRVPYKGSVVAILQQLIGGIKSGMGYTGSSDINTLKKNAQFVKITGAGMHESHVHDVTITKEPPNYQYGKE